MTAALISSNESTAVVRRPYLTPVPDCEPPFDDERSAVSRLRLLRGPERPAKVGQRTTRVQPRVNRLTPALLAPGYPGATLLVPDKVQDPAVPGWSQDADMGVRRTATAELPPATRTAPVLARALVEVMCGQRPLSQLRVHTAPDVFAGMQSRPITRGPLGHLLSVRVCEPADGVAEVSVVFRRAKRVSALAFRLQGVDGRWRVTALQTG